MPQHLTLAEVKAACRQAYADRRLLAQHPRPGGQCRYSYRNLRCAIGAALSPSTLCEITLARQQEVTIRTLITEGFVTVPTDEVWALRDIQTKHDRWLFHELESDEEKFLSAIQE